MGKLKFNFDLKVYLKFCMFSGSRYGKCQCKDQPTTEKPKQCQELEGKPCWSDEDCGEGGFCIPHDE